MTPLFQLARGRAPARSRDPGRAEPLTAVAVRALAEDLGDVVRGEVRFSDGDRALYATDASNYRQVPIGVVVPIDVDDLVATVAVARRHGAPVLPRGGGTSLAGQCCNVALVIDCSKYLHRVLEVDATSRRARVEPGTILDSLRDVLAPHGLTFGPDPATHDHCVIGGMIGNNSCGIHSMLSEFHGPGPRTDDNIETLDILTYDGLRLRVGPTSEAELARLAAEEGRRGEIHRGLRDLRDRHAERIRARFPDILRRVSGYNLPALLPENGCNIARALVGSEGTCVTFLEATLTLVRRHPCRALLVLGYPTVYDAATHVPVVREYAPVGLEGLDAALYEFVATKHLHDEALRLFPQGKGWLLAEFGGETQEEATGRARDACDDLRRRGDAPEMRIYESEAEQHEIWEVRESGLGATAFVPGEPDTWPGWEDSAVPVEHVGDYLRDFRRLLDAYGFRAALYGHFGQGCIHTRIPFDLTSRHGIAEYEAFTKEAAELAVVRYGGSVSGEHGDGQARGDLLRLMYGDDLVQAFREFKAIWDPEGKMNPGKVVDALPRTANLRLGTEYAPAEPDTHFRFPEDEGRFSRAALRCVGVGECRRLAGGTMCPSYMVLREEKHSTRGRAHLLFEMLQGELITDGWRSEAVKESLDLCLACKGCKGECPVNVDIGTYKSEFLAHYHRGRLRPRHAYAFGLIPWAARMASLAPTVVNAVTHAPVLGAAARWLADMAPEREIPHFAARTFRQWFRGRRHPEGDGRTPVILWPDTFNDHFHPGTLVAATEVLETAGHHVLIPRAKLCCGRPLYEYGMLNLAKRQLRQILGALADEIRAGVPVVGLEPSCVAVFRDELTNLFPDDPLAYRLRDQTRTFGELLSERAADGEWLPPRLERKALVHGHCHHKAIMTLGGETATLDRIGLDYEVLDSGCCGMAGAFGFERDKYDVSVAVGERVLLPRVREASAETLVVADGFSCREQIAQLTDRRAMHLAEVMQATLHERVLPAEGPPERALELLEPAALRKPVVPPLLLGAVAGAGMLLSTFLLGRRAGKRAARATLHAAGHPPARASYHHLKEDSNAIAATRH